MENIHTHIKVCKICQKNKKQNLKYGFLPAKETEAISQDRLSVYLICPYKTRIKFHYDSIILRDLTMIYLTNGWLKS